MQSVVLEDERDYAAVCQFYCQVQANYDTVQRLLRLFAVASLRPRYIFPSAGKSNVPRNKDRTRWPIKNLLFRIVLGSRGLSSSPSIAPGRNRTRVS